MFINPASLFLSEWRKAVAAHIPSLTTAAAFRFALKNVIKLIESHSGGDRLLNKYYEKGTEFLIQKGEAGLF